MLGDMMLFASHARPEPTITSAALEFRFCVAGRVPVIRSFKVMMSEAILNVLIVAIFAIETTVARVTVIHSEYD
ncbi:hypothetical protein BELL_0382g00030 [Botrytis elliptica]|uniref:Uncharacterized protein n=1 Tax=Botrytis elliptica TaxID=278938 RepID=A0A4Z1JW97_9HELO|nr:hypothetical protein BELL_0382g00030 [Botrytis elliptica]